MESPERQLEVITAWVDTAQEDLRAIAMLQAEEGTLRAAAFHGQQAVEKLLKSLLISYGIEPDDSHVLGRLVSQLHRLDRGTAELLGPVQRLTVHAVTTRYPPRVGRVARSPSHAQLRADLALATSACQVLVAAVERRVSALRQV